MFENQGNHTMDDDGMRALLEDTRTIAVVGVSTDPAKPSHRIPRNLIAMGFQVIPVHPSANEILGQKVYRTLADIPVEIDIVNVFRPPAEAPGIAEQAVEVGATALWLQSGITSEQAKSIATDAGLAYVEGTCIGETSRRLLKDPV